MKKILAAFSYIFHPVFIPVYASLFYFLITRNFYYQHEIYLAFLQVLILTVLLPLSIFYLLRSLGLLKSKLTDKKERRLPLAIYALLLLFLLQYSFEIISVRELYFYFLGTLISVCAALMLLLFNCKASLHMIAISSLTMFIISISAYYHIKFLYLIAFFILCTGFVASSRLQSRSNTPYDVALGLLIGVLPQLGLWFIWLLPAL